MKTHRHLILAILIATPALRAERTQTPPIPDFMTPTQLAVWQQERIAKAHAVHAAQAAIIAKASTSSPFYTGKPYLAESGTYSFKYRDYSPEMSRWITVDPSGFPDGANNRVYAAVPTKQIDSNGLMKVSGGLTTNSGGWPGIYNWANYIAASSAAAGGSGSQGWGVVDVGANITGQNFFWDFTPNPFADFINLNASAVVAVNANGTLSYGLSSTPTQYTDGTLAAAISFTVDGANTQTLTLHTYVVFGLNSTSLSGISVNGSGASMSLSGVTEQITIPLGTYTFTE